MNSFDDTRLARAAHSSLTPSMLITDRSPDASALPVWLLLAPRDYLSTFVKLGTIFVLVVGIFAVRPRRVGPQGWFR